jgi:hypothetical protein
MADAMQELLSAEHPGNKAHHRTNVILPHKVTHCRTTWSYEMAILILNLLNDRAHENEVTLIANVP